MVVDSQHFKTDATYVYSGLEKLSLMHLELGDNYKTIRLSMVPLGSSIAKVTASIIVLSETASSGNRE